MPDVLGWRKVFAVIGPSTNTVVQPDMEAMRPPGVTNQYRDIFVENPEALSDETFAAGTVKISQGVTDSLRTALSCAPDHIVMGISAISFWGGLAGATAFAQELAGFAGRGVSVAQVSRFLADCGVTVVRDVATTSTPSCRWAPTCRWSSSRHRPKHGWASL